MADATTMQDAVRIPIYNLLIQAKHSLEAGNSSDAERLCDQAWVQLPEPKFSWDVSYMCLRAVVSTLRSVGKHDKAIGFVNDYLASEYYLEYQDGPIFWLGTLYYEKGELKKAYSYFKQANTMSKGRCFVEEDAKYKQFFKTYKDA